MENSTTSFNGKTRRNKSERKASKNLKKKSGRNSKLIQDYSPHQDIKPSLRSP